MVVLAAIVLRAGRSEDWAPGAAADSPKFIERVPAWLLVLGATGAIAYWIEGTWQDWGALHLERTLDAPPAVSALGPALAGAMTVGRLGGNSLLRRWSERRLLVIGALVAAAGTALAAVSPTTGLALAGIVLAGAGCAVRADAHRRRGSSGGSHERATIVGLDHVDVPGFLGPAAVGAVAELATLQASLTAVAGLALLLGLLFAFIPLPTAFLAPWSKIPPRDRPGALASRRRRRWATQEREGASSTVKYEACVLRMSSSNSRPSTTRNRPPAT